MSREIETKYDVDPSFTVPDLAGVPGCVAVRDQQTYRLVATYFDTDDLRLAANGITLRRRRGGADAGWHLKLPEAKGVKLEVRAPLRGRVVPTRLSRLVTAFVRGRKLIPVAELETRRSIRELLDADGTVLVEVADDAVIGQVLFDGQSSAAWREVEVELKAGPPALLTAVGDRLRAVGARPAQAASKLGRLLGTRVPAQPTAGRVKTAGDVARAALASYTHALLVQDPRVRVNAADSVHQMRVATRKLRSTLRTFAPVLDRDRTRPLEQELKWLAGVLGEARDLEVIRGRLVDRLAGLPPELLVGAAGERLRDHLAMRENAALEQVAETLSQQRYLELLDTLDAVVADPPFTDLAARPAAKVLPDVVARGWRRVRRAFDAAERVPDPQERMHALHEVRKIAKQARYTAEAATGVLGKRAAEVARLAETVQETLGRYQDCLVAQETLLGVATGLGQEGANAFTLGVLIGMERAEAERAMRDFERAWRRAAHSKLLRALAA